MAQAALEAEIVLETDDGPSITVALEKIAGRIGALGQGRRPRRAHA